MMTYTECYMAKCAKNDPSEYENIAKKIEAGDEATLRAMNTPSGQEIFWNVAGAGLGGLGAYLLSSRFRRKASRRQRAIDTLLGALLGFGGTQVALNLTGDEKSGLSLKDVMRADKLIGDKARDNSKGKEHPNPLRINAITATTTGGGGALGFALANQVTRHGRKLEDVLGDREIARQLKLKSNAGLNELEIQNPQVAPPNAVKAIEGQRAFGRNLQRAAGTATGAAAGYGVGVLTNAVVDAINSDNYTGGVN